jgi:hypothetical protein
MKLLSLMLFAAVCSGQIAFHGVAGQTTADVKSYVLQEPDIPGMGGITNMIGFSFSSTDTVANSFTACLELLLDDGSTYVLVKTFNRATYSAPMSTRIDLGVRVAVKIKTLTVAPQYQQLIDHVVAWN